MQQIAFILFLFLWSVGSLGSAETLVLKSGESVEGSVVERTGTYIKIDFNGVPLTYFLEDVESIDGIKVALEKKEENSPVTSIPGVGFKVIAKENKDFLKDKKNNSLIHKKEGEAHEGKILRRVKDIIWYDIGSGVDVGISTENVDFIETTSPDILTNTYINDPYGIFLQGPKDWVMVTPEGWYKETRRWSPSQLVYFYKYPPEEKTVPAMGFSLEKDVPDATALDYVRERHRLLKKAVFPDLRIVQGPVEVDVNGMKWIRSVGETQQLKTLEYYLLKNGILYGFGCVSSPGDFEADSVIFEEVIKSFELRSH